MTKTSNVQRRFRRSAGISLVEMLVALAITAILLAAVMVALDASFKAYSASAEQVASQATTRMVAERLLQLIRTSTVAGPTPPIIAVTPNPYPSSYVCLLSSKNVFMKIEYNSTGQQLWLYTWSTGTIPSNAAIAADTGYASKTPILNYVTGNISPAVAGGTNVPFSIQSRQQVSDGTWVVQRATVDLTVQPPADKTLAYDTTSAGPASDALNLEHGNSIGFRVVASTMPRKLQ